MANCPSCHMEVKEGWRFCPSCRQPLAPEEPLAEAAHRGFLPPDLLAHRIQPQEMRGLLSKALVVEEGQVVVLLVGGRHEATLGPGRHSIGNILSSQARDTDAVLFRSSDVAVDASVSHLLTSDPLPIALDCRLTLKVERPLLCWDNLVQGADSYAPLHLAAALYPLMEEGCQSFIRSRSVREMDSASGTRQELQMALASHLEQPLTRWGLRLVSLQLLGLRSEAWDRVNEQRTDYFIAASREEVALEGRKRLFDVHQESDIQAMAEETAKVVGVENRLAVWERLRQATLADARGRLSNQAELEELLRQADKEHLLKDYEREALARTLAEAKDDAEKARAFLVRRVEAEREHELRKLELAHRFGLEQERLAWEVNLARQDMEGRWELGLRKLDLEIEKQRREQGFRRQQEAEEGAAKREREVAAARAAGTIGDVEREQDTKDAEMAIGLYKQYKGVKREDQLERQRAELEAEERRLKITLEAEERRMEMRLKESGEQHSYELQRIEALSKAGIEAMIAVSGPEQAQLLGQLARTRAMAGCTPEQILAMQAHESPQVAEALKEMLTATAASGQLQQYERLVEELKDSARLGREDYQHNLKVMTEMFHKAMDSVRDTAVAFSGQPRATGQG